MQSETFYGMMGRPMSLERDIKYVYMFWNVQTKHRIWEQFLDVSCILIFSFLNYVTKFHFLNVSVIPYL